MANRSFSRKRKPAGLTTSYELKDHMVSVDANNTVKNPHPQYVLRSEVVSGGGDSNLVMHMADPNAHSNYYVQLANVTHLYNYTGADIRDKVTSAEAVTAFYQIFLGHNHDQTYLKLAHETDPRAHEGLFAKISDIQAHNAADDAHPGKWVDEVHVITLADPDPDVIDHRHVPGYERHRQLALYVDSMVTVERNTDNFIIGPAANNPLAPIFAPIVHTHTYADTGAAPTVHYHDDRYSPLDHDHDDRYSLIHGHPYLSDTALADVGIYPSMAITDVTQVDNPDYDPDDAESSQYITEPVSLDTMTTQGWYSIKSTPVDAPYRTTVIDGSNYLSFYNKTVYYVNDNDVRTPVVIEASNYSNYMHMPVQIQCTVGVLDVRVASISDEEGESNNVSRTVYQTFTDESGAVLKRKAVNAYVNSYILTADEVFQDGVTYYTKSGDVYTAATVTVGNAVPADTYYVENGVTEEFNWTAWTDAASDYIPQLGNRQFVTHAANCICCYSKTSGMNYYDFVIPTSIANLVNNLTAELDVLLECNVTNSTFGYTKGDVIVNPIVSNKANNESSFLGHAQTAIMTVNARKVIRMYLPLVWYVKVADAAAESNVAITSSNVHKYYRRTFTYTENGSSVSVIIDASTAASVIGKTGTIAAITYGSKTIPVATQAECGEWKVRARLRY